MHRGILAISGNANVTNEGTIEATGTGTAATAIASGGTLNVDNSGSIFVSAADAVGAIESVGDGTVRNSGNILSGGSNGFGIKSDTGALTVNNVGGTISVAGNSIAIAAATDATVTNSGRIAGGIGGTAIKAGGTATVSNDQSDISRIVGGLFGINAQTIMLTGNIGTIAATEVNGVAINAGGDANVTNGTGTITASNAGGIAIAAGGKARWPMALASSSATGSPLRHLQSMSLMPAR